MIGWSQLDTIQLGLTLGASGSDYCRGEDARNILIDSSGWTIDGDHFNCTDLCVPWTNTWVGISNGNWNQDPANWSRGLFPDLFSIVDIPSGNEITILNGTETQAYTLEIQSGGSLTIEESALFSIAQITCK